MLLYFDKQDGYLVKMQERVKGMTGGEVDEETLYGDYRDFDGVRSYKKMTTKATASPSWSASSPSSNRSPTFRTARSRNPKVPQQ